jgi:glycosyltransferase involved in cell wall biosynthesis
MDLKAKKRGSMEEQLFALGRRLSEAGVACTFVFSGEAPSWMRDELERAGVAVRALDFRRSLVAMVTLGRWLRAARPTLVHFHFVRAHSPLVALARLAGARVVVHDHLTLGVAFVDVPARRHALVAVAVRNWKRFRSSLLRPLIDKRIAVSRFVAHSLAAHEFVEADRVEVLEHGINLQRHLAVDGRAARADLGAGERPVIVCVSRMAPGKGVDVLLRAHAALGRDALLVIAGDGPDQARCQRLAKDLQIAERVRFLGLRSDISEILAACDVAVVPSQAPEAFGFAVIEAMAAGRPVVVTDAGALAELVDHGRCGIVVARADVAALAAGIGRLLDGPVFARALGNAGRERALARHGLTAWVDRLIRLYGSLAPTLASALSHNHRQRRCAEPPQLLQRTVQQ